MASDSVKHLYPDPPSGPKKIWAALLTNATYLRAVLTLYYNLIVKVKSKHPLYIFYTDVSLS